MLILSHTWQSKGNWKGITGKEIRKEIRKEKAEGGQGVMRERDVIYVWSRFTPSSPYHETSPGSDNHTAADVYVCESVRYNSS